eukprot:TRINITY_DN63817_c0_g1_i1.p1 TRINITY_DN63817_c0_g1~~TRINITY_DN63817_c0_g1_i1.p1  ORF type:complete len:313 (+),score=73.18 TRINITY_DN63817_c0_g1_i1:20-958(+)
MPGEAALAKKAEYHARLEKCFDTYSKILIVHADNVRSSQFQSIRQALRGQGEVLMGKNTLIRYGIKKLLSKNPKLEVLLGHLKSNIGFVFTNGSLADIKKLIGEHRVGAPARAGAIAPNDVIVPAGNTGMEPTQTSFLQALNIASKISKGSIEILNDVHLIKEGDKVGASEATLLQKLDIKPFTYGLEPVIVYEDGDMYDPKALDVTEDQLSEYFQIMTNQVACISLATGLPTLPAAPHYALNVYKDLLSVAVEANHEFDLAKDVFAYLKDPTAFAAAAPAAAASSGGGAKAAAPVEEEEEEDEDMGMGLFG